MTRISVVVHLVVWSLFAAVASPSPVAAAKPRAVLDGIDYSYTNLVAAFSRDSKTLASGGPPGSLKVWDAAGGKLAFDLGDRLGPLAPWVKSLAYSPVEDVLAVGTERCDVEVWDLKQRELRRRLTGHDRRVWAVAFAPDGKLLASASWDGTVRLWQLSTGKTAATFKGHTRGATALAFSPDGKALITGSVEGELYVHDTANRRRVRALRGHKDLLTSLAVSKDGATLVSTSRDGVTNLWELKTGKLRRTIKSLGFSVLTKDGKHVITAGDKYLEVCRVADGKSVAWHRHRYTYPHCVTLSPDGKTLALVLDDSRVLLWDVAKLYE